MKKWTRRSILAGSAIAAVCCTGVFGGRFFCGNIFRIKKAGASALTSLYPDIVSARALGEKYLSMTDTTVPAAVARLQTDKRLATAAESSCTVSTASAVEQACREDFRAGRFYCIDGWVLARTELDIAAICTLV
jgi:hypothetical protein